MSDLERCPVCGKPETPLVAKIVGTVVIALALVLLATVVGVVAVSSWRMLQ